MPLFGNHAAEEMTLKDFYDRYKTGNKRALNNEKLTSLIHFQTFLINSGFIDPSHLRFDANGILEESESNLRYFHFKLLTFFLHYVKHKAQENQEPFFSIQVYFVLQSKGTLFYNEGTHNPTRYTPADFLEQRDNQFSFKTRIQWLKNIINAENTKQRNPLRLHTKLLRLNKPTKPGSASSILIAKINNRISNPMLADRAIIVNDYSARSLIIALQKTMRNLVSNLSNDKNIFNGTPIYFQLGNTLIRWLPTPKNQHGRAFIAMCYWKAAPRGRSFLIDSRCSSHLQKKILHEFPYEKV